MASNIDTQSLDEFYPVAGIDNNSQGFRDNFSSIKNNLDIASTEITTLQNKTGGLTVTENALEDGSDFQGRVIEDAIARKVTPSVNTAYGTGVAVDPIDPANTFVDCSYEDATVHVVTASEADILTINPVDFPPNRYAEMRLIIANAWTVDASVTIANRVGNVFTDDGAPAGQTNWSSGILTLPANSSTNKTIVDVCTYDGGANFYAKYVGRFT